MTYATDVLDHYQHASADVRARLRAVLDDAEASGQSSAPPKAKSGLDQVPAGAAASETAHAASALRMSDAAGRGLALLADNIARDRGVPYGEAVELACAEHRVLLDLRASGEVVPGTHNAGSTGSDPLVEAPPGMRMIRTDPSADVAAYLAKKGDVGPVNTVAQVQQALAGDPKLAVRYGDFMMAFDVWEELREAVDAALAADHTLSRPAAQAKVFAADPALKTHIDAYLEPTP